jgi:hypothetical protein
MYILIINDFGAEMKLLIVEGNELNQLYLLVRGNTYLTTSSKFPA